MIAIVGSVLTFAGLTRMLWMLFGPRVRVPHRQEHTPTTIGEAPLLALLPIAVMVVGSLVVGLNPEWLTAQVAAPSARALYDRQAYIMDVMGDVRVEPQEGSSETEPEHETFHAPAPFDLSHWGIPLLVAIVGSAIAAATLNTPLWKSLPILHPVMVGLRRLHSGIVGDYALWNAFGTALLLLVILIATRRL